VCWISRVGLQDRSHHHILHRHIVSIKTTFKVISCSLILNHLRIRSGIPTKSSGCNRCRYRSELPTQPRVSDKYCVVNESRSMNRSAEMLISHTVGDLRQRSSVSPRLPVQVEDSTDWDEGIHVVYNGMSVILQAAPAVWRFATFSPPSRPRSRLNEITQDTICAAVLNAIEAESCN
jgi:hypothetical protein